MEKFDRVLNKEDEQAIIDELGLANILAAVARKTIQMAEQAAIAKYKAELAEQEPIAWVHPDDPSRSITHHQKLGAIKDGGAIEKTTRVFSIPAYAHPTPCVSNANDKTASVSESGESETQEPVAWVIDGSKGLDNSYVTQREAEAKAMIALGSEVEPLYAAPQPTNSAQIHRSLIKSLALKNGFTLKGEDLHEYVYNFANELASVVAGATFFDKSTKNHIADGGKMVADMFWNAEDPERPEGSIHCILVSVDAEVGQSVEIQRAISLSNIVVRVTGYDDEENEYKFEVVSDHIPDASNMIWCACGDGFEPDTFGAGFIAARGQCQGCDAEDKSSVVAESKAKIIAASHRYADMRVAAALWLANEKDAAESYKALELRIAEELAIMQEIASNDQDIFRLRQKEKGQREAISEWLELKDKIKKSGRPPHADYWNQSIYEAENKLRLSIQN